MRIKTAEHGCREENSMKNPVIIKSFPNGISIWLDDEMPFSQLIQEVAFKFKESAHFFKDASMVLSFEGRELSDFEGAKRKINDAFGVILPEKSSFEN